MIPELLQLTISGITVGAVYALVALGFTLIYNASGVLNFAQGDFVMLGGMTTVSLFSRGVPLPLAMFGALLLAGAIGWALHRFAIVPAGNAAVVSLIIITLGASTLIKGIVQVVINRQINTLPAFSGTDPLTIAGASLDPQSVWVVGGCVVCLALLAYFLRATRLGKALIATSANRLAAQLVGINIRFIVGLAFVVSAVIGAIGGILITPIVTTSSQMGTLLAIKGMAGAMLGGLGSPFGAVIGGVLLGLFESYSAGYLSSAYRDAVSFVIIVVVLLMFPSGIFGKGQIERV